MALTNFKHELEKAKKTSIDGQHDWWIPRVALQRIMTTERIHIILEAIKINATTSDSDHERELKKRLPDEFRIAPDKKSTLALLVHLDLGIWMTSFAELPGSLPLTEKQMEGRAFQQMGKSNLDRILAEQYHFIEVDMEIGSLYSKKYDDEIIVPFAQLPDSICPSGAFGVVRKFSYTSPRDGTESHLARKQFKPSVNLKSTHRDYITELRNLTVLSSAHHPNIVRPVAAYLHRGQHNLVFPLAEGGNLEEALDGERKWMLVDEDGSSTEVPHFSKKAVSDHEVVSELACLASAISTLHNLQTDTVSKIGCHRDLKPANVLVQRRRLILADFGLSRMRKEDDSSDSRQPNVWPEFVAPECYDQKKARMENARRSSDIWSLACIYLKILILREHGLQALQEFENDNINEVDKVTYACFFEPHEHAAGNKLRPPVVHYLQKFKNAAPESICCQRLGSLLDGMLAIEQESRPSAAIVTAQLQHLAITLWGVSIHNLLQEYFDRKGAPHVMSEIIRFTAWLNATGTQSNNRQRQPVVEAAIPIEAFERLIHQLSDLYDLAQTPGILSRSRRMMLQPLRFGIDQLLSTLDEHQSLVASEYMKAAQLIDDSRSGLFEAENEARSDRDTHAGPENIVAVCTQRERLIRLKRMQLENAQISPAGDQLTLFIDFHSLKWINHEATNLYHVKLRHPSNSSERSGLAEEAHSRNLSSPSRQREVRERLIRLEQTAKQISQAAKSGTMAVLPCVEPGFYMTAGALSGDLPCRAGLVYQYPEYQNARLTTLEDILKGRVTLRLKLGQKFQLAHRLSSTIYNLHLVKWLHRRLSAANVVFFYNTASQNASVVNPENFYVVGFAASRADEPNEDTEGNNTDEDRQCYLHPSYRARKEDFKASFDWYSLGILLLELGRSKLYEDQCKELQELQVSLESVERVPLEHFLEELEYVTGSRYRNVVEACLGINAEQEKVTTAESSGLQTWLRYESEVVGALRQCCGLDL